MCTFDRHPLQMIFYLYKYWSGFRDGAETTEKHTNVLVKPLLRVKNVETGTVSPPVRLGNLKTSD